MKKSKPKRKEPALDKYKPFYDYFKNSDLAPKPKKPVKKKRKVEKENDAHPKR